MELLDEARKPVVRIRLIAETLQDSDQERANSGVRLLEAASLNRLALYPSATPGRR